MNDRITIDDETILALSREWSRREAEATDRQSEFNWDGARGNLGADWTAVTKAGADGYGPGDALTTKIEGVRAKLLQRISTFGDHAYVLHYGLRNVARDAETVEDYNSMTASKWDEAFPAVPTKATSAG